jgi:hypothetical protein
VSRVWSCQLVLGDIDLHNFAGFDGFRYARRRSAVGLTAEGTSDGLLVGVEWDCSAAGRAWRASPPQHVTVWFEGVRSLNVSGRDQHLPRSEDRGLEDFTCQTFTASDVRFQFRFGSSTTIDIVAHAVSARLSAD